MIDDPTTDLAIDYVLGCLPDDQLDAFDARLAVDAEAPRPRRRASGGHRAPSSLGSDGRAPARP